MREVSIRATRPQREFMHRAIHDNHYTKVLGFGGSRFGGKAQPLDVDVMTPHGPRKMGSLKVGSPVSNPDGTVSSVIGVYPQGIKPCYKITFDDGAVTRACGEHLWNIHWQSHSQNKRREDGRWIVATTEQILERMKSGQNAVIPVTAPVKFTMGRRVPLTIDPYALGLLLGDGCLSSKQVNFFTDDVELINGLQAGLGIRFRNCRSEPRDYRTSDRVLIEELERLNLYGTKSATKFVPKPYLMGSIEERRGIVQGLMDTDGYVDSRGHTSYTTVSPQLAQDMQFMLRSLGYKCSSNIGPASYVSQKTGERVQCQDAYTLEINGPNPELLFRLQRKIERCRDRREAVRRIVSIEPDGECEMQCISVDRPNSLYLTDDFIVTHNTFSGCIVVILRALLYPGTMHLCLRRVLAATDMNLGKQMKKIFKDFGLPFGKQSTGMLAYLIKEKQFVFPNGSIIQLGYCKQEDDYEQHVGTQWDTIWIEQAEQFPENVYDDLKGSNRKSLKTDCVPRFLLTFNPGGRGHEWLVRRIIKEETRQKGALFIKSVIRECLATLEQDPNYILRSLNEIKDPIRRKQWLEGDWDAKAGSYFMLKPDTLKVMRVPAWADWYGGVDWGRAAPFCYLQAAHWQEPADIFGNPGKRHIHICGEVYQRHLDLDIQAERSLEQDMKLRQQNPLMHEISTRFADPSVFNVIESESKDTTRSKADVWAKHGFYVYPSLRYSRVARWELIRYLMSHGILTIDPEQCPNGVNEIKSAIYKKDSEDLDQQKSADHFCDAMAYLCCPLFGLDYSEEKPQGDYELQDFLRVA